MANRFVAGLNSRLLALTIARRNVRRNRLQSLLIILVISLPVAVGALGLTAYQSSKATPQETVELNLGQTQAVFTASQPPSKYDMQAPLDRYAVQVQPDGSATAGQQGAKGFIDPRSAVKGYRWIPESATTAEIKTATGQGVLDVVEGKPWAAQMQGRYFDLTGRAPKNSHELMVNRAALTRLGLTLGQNVTVISGHKLLTIVGTLESASATSKTSVLFALPGAISGANSLEGFSFYAVGSRPITWAQITKLNRQGIGVLSRAVILHQPDDIQVPLYQSGYGNPNDNSLPTVAVLFSIALLVPIVLLPVAVLAGSAFSFGARRQARTLAVISSLGAKSSMLRFMTIANGLVLGAIGGIIGVLMGATAAVFAIPLFSDGSRVSFPGFHLPWGLLVLTIVSGAVIGAIVSVIPAFAAAKVDVLNTLRGTRKNAKVKKTTGFGGLVIAALGVVGALACAGATAYIRDKINAGEMNPDKKALIGPLLLGVGLSSVTIVVGLLMGSAWLLVFVRAALKRISTVSNYATNDLIYNRKRYTAVIASVLATSFVAASLMGILYSAFEHSRLSYRPQAEANQLVIDNGLDYGEKPITKAQLDQKLAKIETSLKSNLATAQTIAQTSTSAVLYRHEEFTQLGYGIDSKHVPIVGAEGQQPYVMRDLSYLCPFMDGSAVHAKWQALEDAHKYTELRRIESQPKYDGCDNLSDSADRFLVGTPSDLRAILEGKANPAAEKQLASGGAVAFHKGVMFGDNLKLNWYPSYYSQLVMGSKLYSTLGAPMKGPNGKPYALENPSRSVLLPAVLVQTPIHRLTAMISPETAKRLGISFHASMLVASYAHPQSTAQQDELNQAFGNGSFVLEQGFGFDAESIMWWFTLAVGFFVLASTGIALGLAQIESRADQSTLSSIGAPKRFRANVVGSQALILTLLGSALGAAVGYFLASAMVSSIVENAGLAIPEAQTVVMLVGIPLLAATIFWVGVPSTAKYRTRQSLD